MMEDKNVTAALAEFIVASDATAFPEDVTHEAKRALLNWTGCALGGSRDATVDIALAAIAECTGAPHATVLGRSERLDVLNAAAINALASNILDFDDTHLRTVIHPSVPVAAAALALAERLKSSGADLLHAFILGVETECRIGNAITPEHYDAGWHVTATCGIFGAAAACAKLLGLDVRQTQWAFGLATNQACGTVGALGSMTKSWNMASAARGGLLAAMLASKGFTSPERSLEGKRSFPAIFSPRADLTEIARGLGKTWELLQNAYKPYPCGIVAHPVIDGCLEVRAEHRLAPESVARIELQVHPLVMTLMGNPTPRTGLEAKLSVHHCAAGALVRGEVGVREFTDACANDPAIATLRAGVSPTIDPTMPKEAARVVVHTKDGGALETYVAQATGSLERPMTDEALETKFLALAAWGAPSCDAAALVKLAWTLDELDDAGDLARETAN